MDPREKFSRLYRHQVEKIYRFIFFKVETREVAEDLTSEVFRRTWIVYQLSFDPSSEQEKIENPRAFLYQSARNMIIDHYRRQSKQSHISNEDLEIADTSQDTEKDQNLKIDVVRIHKALRGLKDEYQDVLVQYYLNNFSLREIAKDSGQSLSAVKITLHRARIALKGVLES